jgi:cation diffusion facilitator family transporter
MTEVADDCCTHKEHELAQLARGPEQRRTLFAVLAINIALFFVEFGGGLLADSSALIADSADNFGDAVVYALSLYAIDRSEKWKAGAAAVKGGFMLLIAATVAVEIALKLAHGVPPSSSLMLGFGVVALAANLTCLGMLWRFRNQDLNMSSTFECSRNDVIGNTGVLVAAGLVAVTASPWPDIAVACVIAAMFLRSATGVLRSAFSQLRTA